MRALPLMGALAAVLALCGSASAQSTTGLYQSSYATSATSSNLYRQSYAAGNNRTLLPANTSVTRTALNGGFSAQSVFDRFASPSPRESFTPLQTLPDPQQDRNGYLRAIGLRPLR